ncbi:hypothetical protein WDA79_16365, partial [Streptomyces sp. A475]|uniref:hypothetical protein n=1 Tax=Streptomyces sp. A475 TaxID=3131976 RepID=UPI0030C91E23
SEQARVHTSADRATARPMSGERSHAVGEQAAGEALTSWTEQNTQELIGKVRQLRSAVGSSPVLPSSLSTRS